MNSQQILSLSQLEQLKTSGAGYDILRYIGLPDVLGEQSETILYFLGRQLARKFDIQSLEELIEIYQLMDWGKLDLVKKKKKEWIFHLMSDSVFLRLKASFPVDFRLEAGFLAEALQNLKQVECECTEDINKRIHLVKFSVHFIS